MFVRAKRRFKDGKEHRYWSVVENCRNRGGRVVQRQVVYLGEINDSQRSAWCRSIEVLQGDCGPAPMALFPDDREAPELTCETVRIHVKELSVHRPRQWGGCWLALTLGDRLELDRFWAPRLSPSRQVSSWRTSSPSSRASVARTGLASPSPIVQPAAARFTAWSMRPPVRAPSFVGPSHPVATPRVA